MDRDASVCVAHKYLEQRLEERLLAERELNDEKFASAQRALELQAREYERRLEVLNHAHSAAIAEQARVLPREMHDTFLKEYELFRKQTSSDLAAIAARSRTWTVAVSVGLSVLVVVITIVFRVLGTP